MATATVPNPNGIQRKRNPNRPPSDWLGLDEVVDEVTATLPNRIILHSVPGFGKTNLAAYLPGALFIQSRRETGLQTLISSGVIQHKVSRFPRDARHWTEAMTAISELTVKEHSYRYLVIDVINGLYEMLVEHICEMKYNSNMEEFQKWGQGMKLVYPEWKKFLNLLTQLQEKGIGTLALCHTTIKPFKNPTGTDYDRFMPALPSTTSSGAESIWELTDQWADMVLFGMLETHVNTPDAKARKGKAIGGQMRIVHTERGAAWDAKNRHNLPPQIILGTDPRKAWSKLSAAFAKAKQDNSSQVEEEIEDSDSPETE